MEFRVLLCRVTLGNAEVTADKRRNATSTASGRHSVVAYGREQLRDSTFAYSEFACFAEDQVYPEYVVCSFACVRAAVDLLRAPQRVLLLSCCCCPGPLLVR